MEIPKEQAFTIGELQVFPAQNTIEMRGAAVQLQPKVMAVLAYLATHQSRVISKEELIDELWGGRVSHGSVQKSINSLRKALSQLLGNEEIIANYSKKGYQLLLKPTFNVASHIVPSPSAQLVIKKPLHALLLLAGMIALLTFGGGVLYRYNSHPTMPPLPIKNHKLDFSTATNAIHGTGYEKLALPHINNIHVAYVRDIFNANSFKAAESKLFIHNSSNNKTWLVSETNGSWFKLAWSPDQKHLLAIEIMQLDGQDFTPDFFTAPDFLYNIYVISLDLKSDTVLNRALVTQWQGHIFSVGWWDDTTLEFTAKQGTGNSNQRYRLSLTEQKLTMLPSLKSLANPFYSIIQNKKTAVASYHKEHVDIDFFDANQNNIGTWELGYSHIDFSWIPDGSGVLIFSNKQQLSTLDLHGKESEVPFSFNKNNHISQPVYSPNGESIFFTKKTVQSNIYFQALDGKEINITPNSNWNHSAKFSHTGERIAYASARNNEINLWLFENQQERQLTHSNAAYKIGNILWTTQDNYIIYKADDKIYRYSFIDDKETILLENASTLAPIHYSAEINELIVLKHQDGNNNIWRISTTTNKSSQLTFGSIGSYFVFEDNIYFQYANKSGLWALRNNSRSPKFITAALKQNKKILAMNSKGVYFIAGGYCRESDVFYLAYSNNTISTYVKKGRGMFNTLAFNPTAGTLHTNCNFIESNIMLLK